MNIDKEFESLKQQGYEFSFFPRGCGIKFKGSYVGDIGDTHEVARQVGNTLTSTEVQGYALRFARSHNQRRNARQKNVISNPEYRVECDIKEDGINRLLTFYSVKPTARNDRTPHKLLELNLTEDQLWDLGKFFEGCAK